VKQNRTAVTIKDVARVCGVSPSTVSKVLNRSQSVSADVSERVLRAAECLNYRPNSIARSLRRRSTLTIGMINRDAMFEGSFVATMMAGVESSARSQGFQVFLANAGTDPKQERACLETLTEKQVDGFILVDSQVRRRGPPALPLDPVPFVFLYEYSDSLQVPCVIPDDLQGARTATDHLLALGHKRVAYINGDESFEASWSRLKGYRQALDEAGIPFDSALVHSADTWWEEGGYQGVKALYQLADPPTAIFCASDELAIGALDGLRDLSLAVAEDVSLVGYDDRPSAGQKRPPLTTIKLPFFEMGKLAMDLLLAAIRAEQADPRVHRVPCPLITRHSTGIYDPERKSRPQMTST
jgi:DNA-binding LacI/PurR family transcriptional regulator